MRDSILHYSALREGDYGPPMLFSNPEIRRMLRLAKAGRSDVFYDLGCGWGQNLIVAASEFGVHKCVGIEMLAHRAKKAQMSVEKHALSSQIRIVHGQIEHVLKKTPPSDATITLYSMRTDAQILNLLRRVLPNGSKLLYYFGNGIFPEIKPDSSDYPFFLSKTPFRRPKSEREWITAVSPLSKGHATGELWEELYHDWSVEGFSRRDVETFRKRLERTLARPSE